MKRFTRKEKESARNTPPLRLFDKGTTNKGKVTIKKTQAAELGEKKTGKLLLLVQIVHNCYTEGGYG